MPEPASLSVMGIGMLTMVALSRYRFGSTRDRLLNARSSVARDFFPGRIRDVAAMLSNGRFCILIASLAMVADVRRCQLGVRPGDTACAGR